MFSHAEILQISLFLSLIWYVKFNRLPCSNDKIYDDEVLCIARAISTFSCSYRIWNSYCQNHRRIMQSLPLFNMISYGWIQSPVVSKRKDVQWCFRWWIAFFIDYAWNGCIDRAISTPSWPYCIWNSYIKITTVNLHDVVNDLPCKTVVKL